MVFFGRNIFQKSLLQGLFLVDPVSIMGAAGGDATRSAGGVPLSADAPGEMSPKTITNC